MDRADSRRPCAGPPFRGSSPALERVRPAIEDLHDADPDSAPAFFDALVAAAFSTFANASVDIAVVEAGIGARLDPTRVCRALATCITGVELEHADRLGPTIVDIAREKAAIARPGVPLVLGPVPDAVRRTIERHASRVGSPVRRLGREIEVRFDPGRMPPEPAYGVPRAGIAQRVPDRLAYRGACRGAAGTEVCLAGRAIPVALRQPGRRMVENAALALGLAHEAGALSRLGDAAAGAALGATVLAGRMEVLQENPLVIVDGAHTRASVDALIEALEARRGAPLVAVVSITRGKDSGAVLSRLVQRAGRGVRDCGRRDEISPRGGARSGACGARSTRIHHRGGVARRCNSSRHRNRRVWRHGLRHRIDVHGGESAANPREDLKEKIVSSMGCRYFFNLILRFCRRAEARARYVEGVDSRGWKRDPPVPGSTRRAPYSIVAIATPYSPAASSSHVHAYSAKLRATWISNSGFGLTR